MITVLALALAVAIEPQNTCSQDEQGYCTDQLVRYGLSYGHSDVSLSINMALGTAVSVELPPSVELTGDPPVGNNAILTYRIEGNSNASDAPLRITLWPKPGANAGQVDPRMMQGHKTNILLPLDGGISILLQMKFAPVERSVQRVVFEFPERQAESAYVQKRLTEERHKYFEEVEQQRDADKSAIDDSVRRELSQSMLKPVYCEDLRERAERGLLIVRASRICRIGDNTFVNFSIHNRARDLFSLGSVEVLASNAEGAAPLDAHFEYKDSVSDILLGYDGVALGVASIKTEPGAAPKAIDIRILESGGKKREVNLKQVGF